MEGGVDKNRPKRRVLRRLGHLVSFFFRVLFILVLSGPLLLHGMYEFYFFISKCIL